MTILTYNRTNPSLGDWTRDFDSLFGQMDRMLSPLREESNSLSKMPCDVHESDTGYLISMDVPGFSKEDLHIEVEGNQVTISGERRQEEALKEVSSRRIERFYGKIERSFTLPKGVDLADAKASCENGVLHLAIPKAESAKSRKIEIQEGKTGFLHGVKEKIAKAAAN